MLYENSIIESNSPPHMTNKVDVAILSAMPEELDFFHDYFSQHQYTNHIIENFEFKTYEYNNKKILIAHTGLGTTFAASIVTLIHQHYKPNYLFLSGTAGGINPKLKIRDVVIVERAFEAEIQDIFSIVKGTPFESCLTHPLKKQNFPSMYLADEEMLDIASNICTSTSTIYKGTVVSSNAFPAPKELFDRIKHEAPYSIDMETSAIYQIAWLLNMNVLAVRGISNVLNHDGTDDHVPESDVKYSSEAAAKVVLQVLDALLIKSDSEHSQCDTIITPISTTAQKEATNLINLFDLQPHPEGGYFAQIFKSKCTVKSTDHNRYDNDPRSAGTSIYYLLKDYDFSAWHRLKSDEIWHHYKGSAIAIHVIDDHGELSTHLLGDTLKHSAAVFQVAIPAGCWFAAELVDKASYCLIGCTVNPGFEFQDFELADRILLSEQFPQHKHVITQFTRMQDNEKIYDCK